MERNFLGVPPFLPVWCPSKLLGRSQRGKMGNYPPQDSQGGKGGRAEGVDGKAWTKEEKYFHLSWVKSLQQAQGASWTLQLGFSPDMKYGKALLMRRFHHHRCFASLSSWSRDTRQVLVTAPCDCHANKVVYVEIQKISESKGMGTL